MLVGMDRVNHDHHWRPTPPEAVVPEASQGRFVGVEPFADNDPIKTMTRAQRASSQLVAVVGLVTLVTLAIATLLLVSH